MRLIESVVPAPAHAIVSPVSSVGKVLLRSARWPPAAKHGGSEPAGTVVICTGRSEFIEKYFEVIEELRQRGLAVVAFDWRGQGLSTRLLRNPLSGHVRSFVDYEQDLDAVVRQVLEPFCPRPWFGLAHSMGGPVMLQFASKRPDVFRRLVLSAPMIDIARIPAATYAPLIVKGAVLAGFGRRAVPIGPRRGLFVSTFEGNVLTSDATRFRRTAALLEAEPRLGLGLPTLGWLDAAFGGMAGLQRDAFIDSFRTPTLVIMPADDRVVSVVAAERLTGRLRASTTLMVRGARHEILMERDALRAQFWSAFDAFVPGSPVPNPQPAATAATPAPLFERGAAGT